MCVYGVSEKKTHYKLNSLLSHRYLTYWIKGGCQSEINLSKQQKGSQLPHNMYILKLIQAKQKLSLPVNPSYIPDIIVKMDKTFPLKL